jgi:hypothetical protein
MTDCCCALADVVDHITPTSAANVIPKEHKNRQMQEKCFIRSPSEADASMVKTGIKRKAHRVRFQHVFSPPGLAGSHGAPP